MPHAWQDVGGGILESDDGGGTDVLGETEDGGAISIVRSLVCGRVADDVLSDSARRGLGVPGGSTPSPPS